jgi:protein-S-isoprenylcysteine O-methyltransferase Ste14
MNYYALTVGTILIILFSWNLSIKYKRYHGIARFFAFESILILLLLNYKGWFHNPFSVMQIISWLILFLSIYVVVTGYVILKRRGNSTINFENTSQLVKSGIYKYIRHPLYLSIFLLGTGITLKDPGKVQIILLLIIMISVPVTSRIEENEMIARFGDEYRSYMKESKMFIPFIL